MLLHLCSSSPKNQASTSDGCFACFRADKSWYIDQEVEELLAHMTVVIL